MIIGFILGSIGWAAAVYAVLTIKDLICKRREGNIKLGRDLKPGRPPKLISIDEE